MSKRALSFLSCVLVVMVVVSGFAIVGWPRAGSMVNEIPEGVELERYSRAIVAVESETELEN